MKNIIIGAVVAVGILWLLHKKKKAGANSVLPQLTATITNVEAGLTNTTTTNTNTTKTIVSRDGEHLNTVGDRFDMNTVYTS